MVRVACAIIEHEGKVLAAQRSGTMSNPLRWEFPGGKIEADETAEQCLLREIKEEMGIAVIIRKKLNAVEYVYPEFVLQLIPFICKIEGGEISLSEHIGFSWLAPGDLITLDWSAADIPVVNDYLSHIHFSK